MAGMDIIAFNNGMCEVLGLDPNDVRELSIHLKPMQSPEVHVTLLVREGTENVITFLQGCEFQLVPKDNT